jgi:hypothetical protein
MAAVDESVVRDMVQLVIIASLKEVKNETISHNFKWPNVVDFTPDRAQSTIEQFIQVTEQLSVKLLICKLFLRAGN